MLLLVTTVRCCRERSIIPVPKSARKRAPQLDYSQLAVWGATWETGQTSAAENTVEAANHPCAAWRVLCGVQR